MPSGIWLVCEACGLRHSARQDERCPRCGGHTGAPAPGEAWRPHAASSSGPGNFGALLARLAGGLLILALLLVAARVLMRERSGAVTTTTSGPSEAPPAQAPETQRALSEPPPVSTTPTPTYLQKAFSDLPRSRPAHPPPR